MMADKIKTSYKFSKSFYDLLLRVADWLAKTVMTRMGWFTPPFDTANDVRQRLEPYYDILDFHVEGAMLYFRARKR